MSGSDSDSASDSAPRKRPRPSPTPTSTDGGHPATPPTATVSNGGPRPNPPLSLSILGVEPIDEFIREIADFVHHMILTRPADLKGTIELEAKIGVLRDKHSGQRISLPVLVETPITPNSVDCRFESNMSAMQHKHFNTLLNRLKTTPPPTAKSPIDYKHHRLVDSFYTSDDGSRDKIRVTRDERTGDVRECLRKIRLGNFDIYSPKRAADWRVSVNMEIPVGHPLGTPTHSRRKDRISYSHEEFVIDLTQVVTTRPNSTPETAHELELELARSELLLAAAARRNDERAPESERGAFDELIRAFVNNARILCRNAPPGPESWA